MFATIEGAVAAPTPAGVELEWHEADIVNALTT